MLLTIGDLLEEVLVRLPGVPGHGHDTAVRTRRVRGGSAANVAAITAELGGPARFVGRVGDDGPGHELADDLAATGVDTRLERRGRTGVAISLLDDRGRRRLVDRGASRLLAAIDREVLDDVHQLYLATSALVDEPLAGVIDHLLGDARDRGIAVTLGGPRPEDLHDFGGDAFLALAVALEPESVVVGRPEHAALGRAADAGVPGAATTIVTDGPRPTTVIERGRPRREVDVAPVEVRDLTGVGDAFRAGYLLSRGSGANPAAATVAGHRAAGRVAARLGPTLRR